MLHFINIIIQKLFIREFEPSVWRPLSPEILATLLATGEGLYLVNLRSAPKDFISRIIGLFSGGYSHTVIVGFYRNPQIMMTTSDWDRVRNSLNFFYGNTILDMSQVKTIVLSSANEEGIICCDLSKYNNRKMTIRKLPFTLQEERRCIEFLCKYISKPYDATGLVGWLFKRWDDPETYYCSEICYDACMYAADYKIALSWNPSPGDIEIYAAMNNWTTIYTKV